MHEIEDTLDLFTAVVRNFDPDDLRAAPPSFPHPSVVLLEMVRYLSRPIALSFFAISVDAPFALVSLLQGWSSFEHVSQHFYTQDGVIERLSRFYKHVLYAGGDRSRHLLGKMTSQLLERASRVPHPGDLYLAR